MLLASSQCYLLVGAVLNSRGLLSVEAVSIAPILKTIPLVFTISDKDSSFSTALWTGNLISFF